MVQQALGLAKVIAGKSPVAVSSAKHLITHSRDHSVEENLRYTAAWNAGALLTDVSPRFLGKARNLSVLVGSHGEPGGQK